MDIKLVAVEFREWLGERLNWEIKFPDISSFNLILGDNAQGKTRLFNILRFLKNLDLGQIKKPFMPDLRIESHLWFQLGDEKIEYILRLAVSRDTQKPIFDETIIKGREILFSRNSKTLRNEKNNINVKEFFLPEDNSVLISIKQPEFPTISAIRSFLERMLFLPANRAAADKVSIDPPAMFINDDGSNIGSVLLNWKKNMPEVYDELTEEFIRTFQFVEKGSITHQQVPISGSGIIADLMVFKEKGLTLNIDQTNWSDGMLRSLSLLAIPLTRFAQANSAFFRPSLVFIDELENGLDFKTLRNVIAFYQEQTNLMQVILTSHSPVICNMVDPQNWRVSRREKWSVLLQALGEKNKEIEVQRKNLLLDNWEFYQRYISQQPDLA